MERDIGKLAVGGGTWEKISGKAMCRKEDPPYAKKEEPPYPEKE